jgi:hypothetical protein
LSHEEYIHTALIAQPTQDKPLELPLGEAGNIQITQIDYLSDKTVVHYQYNIDGFGIEDENGRLLKVLSWGDGGYGENVAQFEAVEPGTKLTFFTRAYHPVTYLPELELRVNLP